MQDESPNDWYTSFVLKHNSPPTRSEAEERGFSTVELTDSVGYIGSLKLDEWLKAHCSYRYRVAYVSRYIMFENAADAITYKLTDKETWNV